MSATATDNHRPSAALRGGRVRDGVVGLLAVLTLGSLLLAQHMKHLPSPVEGVVIKPATLTATSTPPTYLQISFHLDKAQRITVEVASTAGKTVATLVRDLPWPANRPLCLRWDGHRGVGPLIGDRAVPLIPLGSCAAAPALTQPQGRPAPPGEYHLRILFAGHSQPLPLPQIFVVRR
jgi:hypothetical protein